MRNSEPSVLGWGLLLTSLHSEAVNFENELIGPRKQGEIFLSDSHFRPISVLWHYFHTSHFLSTIIVVFPEAVHDLKFPRLWRFWENMDILISRSKRITEWINLHRHLNGYFQTFLSVKGVEQFPFEVTAWNCLVLWRTICWQFALSFLHVTMLSLK